MQGIAENLLSIASGTSSQAAATSLGLQSQVVLVLVGLIGSGKSTFAQALQEHYSEFRRCSQDDLGDRRAVESLARRSLRKGHSVCIDRTNIDARQRSTWISIAREIPGTEVWILHFKTPFEVCEDRLRTRQNHPTITSPQQAVEILQRFRSQYQIPREHEGYDRELNLAVDEQQLGYTADDIRDILHRLQESPKIEQSGRWTNRRNNPSYRGQSNYRGYAGSRGSSEYSRGSYNHRRGYSGYRGSGNYHGTSNYRGRGRGDNSTPYLRGNGSFSHSGAGSSYSSTYSTGDSRGNGEGSV